MRKFINNFTFKDLYYMIGIACLMITAFTKSTSLLIVGCYFLLSAHIEGVKDGIKNMEIKVRIRPVPREEDEA